MRGLKILVVAMGVMLFGGIAVLVATVAGRMTKTTVPAQGFVAAPVEIPPGSRVESMSTGPDRVVLDLVLADGVRQLVVIDLASGRKLGVIPLRPGP